MRRIDWLDIAKGYGILFVIIAHCGVGKLGMWFYTFHLPLFFILSGYVFSYNDDFKVFLKKKFKSMIVPYFLLGIPMLLFDVLYHYAGKDYTIHNIISLVFRFVIQRRMWTLWFLACLFCVNIIFYLLIRYFKNEQKVGIVCLVLTFIGYVYYYLGGKSLPWNCDAAFMAITFFYIGYIYKLHHNKVNKYLDNIKISIPLFFILGLLNVGLAYFNLKLGFGNLEMFGSSYGFLPLVYGSAICGSFCVIIFSKWFNILAIRYIGANSLLYFAWHQTIFQPLSEKILSVLGWRLSETTATADFIIYKITYITIILVLITICNLIVTKTKLKIILGK